MCLIISKPAAVNFSKFWLHNFWEKNQDGAGIMWHNGECVEVEKITLPSAAEWVEFYEAFARGRDCVIHLRWRTHGAINEENTHPYYVGRGYWLMHNGILASGNEADTSKSDTWHFIHNILKPALRKDRKCFERRAFRLSLGKAIGANNKFAIMGNSGKPHIINWRTGVEWRGAWFSNRYAWTPPYEVAPRAQVMNLPVSEIKVKPQYFQPKIWTM
jgi:hypothetical protein